MWNNLVQAGVPQCPGLDKFGRKFPKRFVSSKRQIPADQAIRDAQHHKVTPGHTVRKRWNYNIRSVSPLAKVSTYKKKSSHHHPSCHLKALHLLKNVPLHCPCCSLSPGEGLMPLYSSHYKVACGETLHVSGG